MNSKIWKDAMSSSSTQQVTGTIGVLPIYKISYTYLEKFEVMTTTFKIHARNAVTAAERMLSYLPDKDLTSITIVIWEDGEDEPD